MQALFSAESSCSRISFLVQSFLLLDRPHSCNPGFSCYSLDHLLSGPAVSSEPPAGSILGNSLASIESPFLDTIFVFS